MNEHYKKYINFIQDNRALILNAFDYIWQNPEIGYKEWKTSTFLEEQFKALGYKVNLAGNIPGFIAEIDTGRPGPKVAIIGELDALLCETHPEANKETHAVHACGHLIQTSAMLGVAAALKQKGALEYLSGSVRFMAVPAEETIDLEFRNQLIKKGQIKYVAGKLEFMYRGMFDDVDMAIMFHADTDNNPVKLFKILGGMDGCITKHIEYEGVAAHAGGAPYKGVNALYAANLGINACNALRETFQEKDYVRYHPIITSGGSAANAIPDLVKMDTYVRAASFETMLEINKKIDRALAASAAAMGANVRITDTPGNLPLHCSEQLNRLCEEVIGEIFGYQSISHIQWDTQSSDIGDISSLIPTIQPLCMGASGNQHGDDYKIADKDRCVINPAKVMTCMIFELLKEGAALAEEIKKTYQPVFPDKQTYFKQIDQISITQKKVQYGVDGEIVLKI